MDELSLKLLELAEEFNANEDFAVASILYATIGAKTSGDVVLLAEHVKNLVKEVLLPQVEKRLKNDSKEGFSLN